MSEPLICILKRRRDLCEELALAIQHFEALETAALNIPTAFGDEEVIVNKWSEARGKAQSIRFKLQDLEKQISETNKAQSERRRPMTEIERLRADLEAMERLWETVRFGESAGDFHRIKSKVRDKIARLEAEAADPWREAKEYFDTQRKRAKEDDIRYLPLSDKAKHALAYHDHVVAANDRLAKRVAELEAAAIRINFESGFCKVDSDKLQLDPHRTIATACKILATDPTIPDGERLAGALMQMTGAGDAKPYDVEGGNSDGE